MNKHYHFIGISGISMRSLALILKKMGHMVSGIDKNPIFLPKIEIQKKEENVPLPEGVTTIVHNLQTSKNFCQMKEGIGTNILNKSDFLCRLDGSQSFSTYNASVAAAIAMYQFKL